MNFLLESKKLVQTKDITVRFTQIGGNFYKPGFIDRSFKDYNYTTCSTKTHPAAAISHIDVHASKSKFSHLNCDLIEDCIVGISCCPQKGRWALGGFFPRGRHFRDDIHLAYATIWWMET